jgi:hypothetical protein
MEKLRVHLDLTKNNCNSAQAVVLGRISTRHRLQLSSAAVIEEFVDMRVSPLRGGGRWRKGGGKVEIERSKYESKEQSEQYANVVIWLIFLLVSIPKVCEVPSSLFCLFHSYSAHFFLTNKTWLYFIQFS